jgi:hypothetical protein
MSANTENSVQTISLTGKPASEKGSLLSESILVAASLVNPVILTIRLSKVLNTGIASEIIQAITHKTRVITIQDPIENNVRLCR